MGSIEGHAKGQQPMLDRIKALNASHNSRVDASIRAAPFWRKLLFAVGMVLCQPLRNWLDKTYYKEPTE